MRKFYWIFCVSLRQYRVAINWYLWWSVLHIFQTGQKLYNGLEHMRGKEYYCREGTRCKFIIRTWSAVMTAGQSYKCDLYGMNGFSPDNMWVWLRGLSIAYKRSRVPIARQFRRRPLRRQVRAIPTYIIYGGKALCVHFYLDGNCNCSATFALFRVYGSAFYWGWATKVVVSHF
jgi:hypothetical protein